MAKLRHFDTLLNTACHFEEISLFTGERREKYQLMSLLRGWSGTKIQDVMWFHSGMVTTKILQVF